MRYSFLILLLSIYFSSGPQVFAQYENIWAFGKYAGLDFSNGDPVPIQTGINGFGEANASVCDHDGQLLFYTEGSYIWDRQGNLRPNGSDLTPFSAADQPGLISVTSSSCQGSIIIPYPEQDNLYYVFSLTSIEMGGNMGRLYYSLVDMDLNGGVGDVVPGSKGILVDSLLTESMTAVAGDRCNIWLLTRSALFQQIRSYEITASGLNVIPVIAPGGGTGPGGYMTVSSDRKKLAVTTAGNYGVWLYDFDAATGIASNPITLQSFSPCQGAAFSPDDTKLYIRKFQTNSIFQYDIASGDSATINNSEILLGSSESYTHLKLAPNGKIYFHSSTTSLGVINFPNLAGSACGFVSDAVTLLNGTSVHGGLISFVPVITRDTAYSVQDRSAGCFAAQTLISANNDSTGWDYVWNTGNTGAGMEVGEPGTYWVSYHTPPCVYHVDTFRVSFPMGVLPTVTISPECRDQGNGYVFATTYADDPVGYQYIWLSGADTLSMSDSLLQAPSGAYELYVETDTGCDTLLPFVIPEVNYLASFILSDTLLCMGDTLSLNNTSDPHYNQFTWYFGDGDSSVLQQPDGHVYAHHGTYELLLTATGPICKDTVGRRIIIDSLFTPTFSMDQTQICAGDYIRFRLPHPDTTFTGLNWNWGDGSYLNANYEDHFNHAFDSPGLMTVQVILNSRACPDTWFTDTVSVYVLPEVNLGGDTSLCLDGHAVVLYNLTPAPNEAHQYLWNTGDTTASLRALQPGTYSLRITTKPLGCNNTDEIVVSKDCYTDIPNAFTPDGDGDNDYFFPRTLLSQSVSDFKMQVFNRWGQLVFETTKVNGRGWDGRFNNHEQPLGVYVFLIDVAYSNGRKEGYKGNVTLIR